MFLNEYGEEETFHRPVYRNHERNIQEALNVERARLRERDAVEVTKAKLETVEDYQPGTKTGTSGQPSPTPSQPLPTMNTSPSTRRAWQKGLATHAIPLPPTTGQGELEAGRRLTLTLTKNGEWWLLEPETAERALRVKVDARNYADKTLPVTTVCCLPQMEEEPDVTSGETIMMVEITPRG